MREFILKIKNLVRWFIVIWKDRDYDHYFILEILKTKLKHQAKYIGDRDRSMSSKRDSEIMMTCVKLIEKLQTNFYCIEYLDYCNREMFFVPTDSKNTIYEIKINEILENFDEYFAKYPHAYREVKKKYPDFEKDHIARLMGNYMEEKANRLLFSIMQNNLRSWWD